MSPDRDLLALTGVTGNLGGQVATRLSDDGVSFRPVVRSPERYPSFREMGGKQAEYGDADAVRSALEGVSTLFMVSAAESADRMDQHRTFVETAAEAGVAHVVYTSFLVAAPDATLTLGRDHFATEELIRDSGMEFTFLRNSLYLDFLPMMAGEDGVIRGPAGDGKVGAVSREDIARVAVEVLGNPAAHSGRTYGLTGRETISLSEAASILSEMTDQSISYEEETVEEAYESRAVYEAPEWQVDAWVSTYTSIASGELDLVTRDVEEITGEPPLTLREYLGREGRRG